jgi:hypothetical protein
VQRDLRAPIWLIELTNRNIIERENDDITLVMNRDVMLIRLVCELPLLAT